MIKIKFCLLDPNEVDSLFNIWVNYKLIKFYKDKDNLFADVHAILMGCHNYVYLQQIAIIRFYRFKLFITYLKK